MPIEIGLGSRARDEAVKPRRCSGFQWWLSFVTGAMVSGCIAALVFVDIPANNQGVLIGLTGTLVGGWGTILGFEFGSSRSGQAKDDTIASLSKPV